MSSTKPSRPRGRAAPPASADDPAPAGRPLALAVADVEPPDAERPEAKRPEAEPPEAESAAERGDDAPVRSGRPLEAADGATARPDDESLAAVPESARALLALFRSELADVRFPDLDRERLERACAEVHAADLEAARLFAALEAAEEARTAARTALSRLVDKGVAYGRIFAAEDPALLAKVLAIDPPPAKKQGRKPGPGKPGRPRRIPDGSSES